MKSVSIRQRAKNVTDRYWGATVMASVYTKLQADIAVAIRAALAADRKKRRK